MDRPEVKKIREALEQLLSDFDLDGYKVKLGGCTFDADARFKLTVESTNGVNQEQANFNRYAGIYGLLPSDLGRSLKDGGVVVGLKTRATKYPILVDRFGKRYKYSATMVKANLV